jgi:myo-inositol 2-dehydrogenase/D-chiro-inositol 1-dehydrogenase/scyllo-inositol 2-dehydrogenase (NAD+)
MAQARVRVGVIGTGRAGGIHAQNLAQRIPAASLVALCDPDAGRLEETGQRLGVTVRLADYAALVERDDVEAVVIVTPTSRHCEIACAAARHGKHIFLEKPMALTPAECRDINAAVASAGVKLQIGFMRRFDERFRRAKEVLANGELGRVMLIRSTGRGPGGPGPWMYDLRQSNGIVAEVNSHDLDTLRWLTGDEFAQVYAQGRNFKCADARAAWPDFYDTVLAQFTFRSDTLGVLDGACPAHYGYDARVEVLGEKGLLLIGAVEEPGFTKVTLDGRVQEQAVRTWRTLFKDAYLAELEHFVACVQEDRAPAVTGEDGQRAVEAVRAVNDSIRTGQPVSICQEALQ